MFEGVRGAQDDLVVFSPSISSKFLQFYEVAYKILDIFQYTWRSQMSQISKCPKVTVILSYWEALGEVLKLRYKSLLYFSSNGSYCSNAHIAPALVHLCAQRLEKYLHTQEELYLPQKNFYSCTQYQLVYRYIYLYTSCCLLAQYKVRCTLKKYSCLKSLVWTTHRLWRSNVKWICKEKVGTDGFRSMHCI